MNKKLLVALRILVMVSMSIPMFHGTKLYAMENESQTTNLVVVDVEPQNLIGEYIIQQSQLLATDEEKFSFSVRTSVTSSKFVVHSSTVAVSINAYIQNSRLQQVSGYTGHKYTVTISGPTSHTLNFEIGGTESATVRGLKAGEKYTIKITNKSSLPSGYYLAGTCTVS